MPYEITIFAAGIRRTLFAQTEREVALMAESILRRFEGKPALIGFWVDAPDRGALKHLGAYLGDVLAELMGTGEVVA
ncbi:hypothetical protein [Methylobacterium sp. J-092]|uniref:hypothetical protein n=1 Tax=Methylobacterium sp. J-092 TaxID=2836667 RepID=UPI001FBADC49|nr:hypothetical protein [Methylobacterium sp. J-092]MCJ2010771.1 hypothetical protein [Methylobacterium sp. J-092]